MPAKIFFHGGGDRPESRAATFGRFAAACLGQPADKLALVLAEVEETAVTSTSLSTSSQYIAAYRELFTAVGVHPDQLIPLVVTAEKPLTYEMVAQVAPSGVFVCGGVTPLTIKPSSRIPAGPPICTRPTFLLAAPPPGQ